MTTRAFTCAMCGSVEYTDQPIEDVRAEAAANGWGDVADEDMASVCDDCYPKAMQAITS